MKNLNEYLTHKYNLRHIKCNNDGLELIYKFMTEEEKALLKAHKPSITYNNNVSDCKAIQQRYCLSSNEIRFMIMRFA